MNRLLLSVILSCSAAFANTAPNGPGDVGTWTRPDKEAFLATYKQNVWATIADGIITEVYFPTVDRAQTRDTQLLFVLPNGKILQERKDFLHEVKRYPKTLAYHVSSYNSENKIRIEKDIALDPNRPVLVAHYEVTLQDDTPTKIYLHHNPAAENTAGGDAMVVTVDSNKPSSLLSYQSDIRGDEPEIFRHRTLQLLVTDQQAVDGSTGYEGVNAPLDQLGSFGAIRNLYDFAYNGNVAGVLGFAQRQKKFVLNFALAFASESPDVNLILKRKTHEALSVPMSAHISNQRQEWDSYFNKLNPIAQAVEPHILVLKSLEDKTYPGAVIAAPALPNIPVSVEACEWDYEAARLRKGDVNGGYHRVWPRDAVQMSLAFLAVGDLETATNIARHLAKVQLPSGTFPQNTWVDGQLSWTGFQLDQTGFPILLIARLVELGVNYIEFRNTVTAAADALVANGPWTDQERWEEVKGLSPNSIAIACQALMDASWLEYGLNRSKAELYSATCTNWRDNLTRWTFVNNGPLGGNYFMRIEISPDLNHTQALTIPNQPQGGNVFPENEIIDGGFLQWIISGLLSPTDEHFSSSLPVYDRIARGTTPAGLGFIRYNHDAYGMNHVGGVWPLLSGERALAALTRNESLEEYKNVLLGNISPAEMLCEQVSVSACPLGWAHSEVIILTRSIADQKSFYIPRRLNSYF